MKKTVLRKYAQLIAQTGVNVQPGQEVFIAADLDQPEFVKMLVEDAISAGPRRWWWTGAISPCKSSTTAIAP